jgi:hypothetical protein
MACDQQISEYRKTDMGNLQTRTEATANHSRAKDNIFKVDNIAKRCHSRRGEERHMKGEIKKRTTPFICPSPWTSHQSMQCYRKHPVQ